MLELGVGADILRGLSWLYLALIAFFVGISLWFPEGWWRKAIGVSASLIVFVGPAYLLDRERQLVVDEHEAQYAAAKALFQERCKSAGEKIVHTAKDVDGVAWLKWRGRDTNYGDQFKFDDPYGHDCSAEECIANLLRVTKGASLNPSEASRHAVGYRFVETTDPQSGKSYRYSAAIQVTHRRTPEELAQYRKNSGRDAEIEMFGFGFQKEEIEKFGARYGISWDDISTREDRAHWIAGGSLKVIDLQSNEVIAERVGFMMDEAQGSKAGFRSPWLFAERSACPAFDLSESKHPVKSSRSRDFIFRVLVSE